jgi:hypothetical protein
VDRGSSRGRSTCLLPGSVPAGGGAPLWNRTTAAERDRPTAPSAGRRGGPSFSAIRVRAGQLRARRLALGALNLLAPLLLPSPLPFSSPVWGAAAASHAFDCPDGVPVTRHHEFGDPRCMRCDAS